MDFHLEVSDFLFKIIETRTYVFLRLINSFLKLLESFLELIQPLVDHIPLIRQSARDRYAEAHNQCDQLPYRLANRSADDIVELIKAATHFGEFLAVFFDPIPEG